MARLRIQTSALWLLLLASLLPGLATADNEGPENGTAAGAPGDPSDELGPCDQPPEQGQPILLDTGEFVLLPYELTTPDPVIPVRGHTIDLRRSYRSGYAYHGILGHGWDVASNRRLRRLDDGNLLVSTGTCRTAEYSFTGSGWDAPEGVFRKLVLNVDGSYTETSPNGMEHTFDTNGSLIERRDRHGNRIAFEYSETRMPILGRSRFFVDGTPRVVAYEYQLLRMLDPEDREITFTYNAGGRIATVTDWIGRTWSYGYSADGNLTSVTSPPTDDYPSGTTTTYAYADSRFPNKLTSVIPPNGQSTLTPRLENFYDAQGRVERQEDGVGGTYFFSYQETQTVVTDPNGTSWLHTFEDRQATSQTVVTRGVRPAGVEPLGTQYTTSYQYTEKLRTRTVFPEGNAVDRVYDITNPNLLARGNLLEVHVLPKPGSSEPALVTRYTYKTPYQQIGTIEDPRGEVTEFFYDASHNLVRIEYPIVPEGSPTEYFSINAQGQLVSFTDANGNEVEATYDANGYLDTVTRAAGTALAATTEFDPDAVGRPTVVRDANGNVTQLEFNSWDLLESRTSPAPFLYETEYHYDPSGNLATIDAQSEIPGNPQTTTLTYNVRDWLGSVTNELGQTTQYGYDGNGNRTTVTDPQLNVVSRIFDERNLLYQETAANGDVVKLNYHANGTLAAVIDGNGNPTAYDYDDFDRQNLITHADSSTEGRTYDAASRVVSSTTRALDTFTYSYDALNRLRSRVSPDDTALFDFDLGGRMVAASNSAAALLFTYNARDQLTVERTTLPGLPQKVVTHEYDGVGNRTKLIYPDSTYVTGSYDALDRLEQLEENGSQVLSAWGYDPLSRPVSRTMPSGVTSTWTYDRASRVASILHAGPGGTLDSRVYGRDPTGTITSITDLLGVNTYGYDASKQLTSVNYPASASFTDTSWVYDDAGNRLSETASSSTTYVPNALNQYASVGGVTQTYDANGNLTSDGSHAYTFDSENRLAGAVSVGGAVTSYAYDPFMRRTQKTVNGVTTHFLWSGSELIEEYDGSGSREVQYMYATGYAPAHVRTDNAQGAPTLYDVHADHLSTPKVVSGPSGSMAWRGEYAGFGEVVVDPASSIEFNVRFPGQYFDGETGLSYNRFRYYGRGTGRYASVDPIGQYVSVNAYVYARNNGLMWRDILGLQPSGISGVSTSRGNHPKYPPNALSVDAGPSGTATLSNENGDPIASGRFRSGHSGETDSTVEGRGPTPPGYYTMFDDPFTVYGDPRYCDRVGCWYARYTPDFMTPNNRCLPNPKGTGTCGIHPDGRSPGTAGCTGLTSEDSSRFREALERAPKPLTVIVGSPASGPPRSWSSRE